MVEILEELQGQDLCDFGDSVFDEVIEIFKKDENVIILTNDMGARGLDTMRSLDAKRVINVGITEQNMVSVASGLALSGKYVFIYGIISHVIYRAYEQIKLDICVQKLPVTIIGVGAGLAYGVDGPTHHGTEDINALASLPNIEILNPSDDCSARASVRFAYSLKTPCFIRMDKEQLPKLYLNNINLHKGFEVHGDKSDTIIFCSGMTVWSGLRAKEILEKNYNLRITVVDIFRPKNIELNQIVEHVSCCKFVYVVDEASRYGGISNLMARYLCGVGTFSFKILSLPDSYISGSAKREWAWREFGLNPASLVKTILEERSK